MYPVSTDYKNKIKENNRLFECKIQIEHSQGTLYLDDKDLVSGTLTYTESSQAGEEFTVGGTVASDISFTILNKPEYHDITFMGATVFVNIGLQVKEGIDAHFLQPSQPSKMKGFDEKWEYVPLGRFNIDDVNRQRNTIQLKAIDNMINLDKPYSLSKLSYPATLYQIYVNICNVADVPVGTTNFPNKDYVVNIRPDSDLTLRDVLGYVAELAGCFAKCNRNGALELKWYEQTDIILGPENRFNFKPSDDTVQIKGIMSTIEDGTTYLAGSEDYAIDLTENPLLQGDYETVLPNILANVENTIFTPYTSDWQGNPAIQAGDKIVQIDRDGKEYNTLVTKSTYKYRGRSVLEGRGLPEISRGYKGSTNRKIAEIKRKIDVDIGDKLTTLEEQQLQMTELIANTLGGYSTKTEDAFYIHDAPTLENSMKIWKWGLGGFGYSEDGGETYTTGITAEGSIVAELVSAGIITADMVQTGILQSEDGSTWINLDNGTFNFKNALKWYNNQLVLNQGIVTIDKDKIRVNHGGTNQYSEMRADGFVRKYANGEVNYLNGIYVEHVSNFIRGSSQRTPFVYVEIPMMYKGRQDEIDIILIPSTMRWTSGKILYSGALEWMTNESDSYIEYDISRSNFNPSVGNPYIAVRAEVRESYYVQREPEDERLWYHGMDFVIMIIGR